MDSARRLEEWSNAHKSHSVVVSCPDSYGAACWTVTLGHAKGVTVAEEASFWTFPEEEGGDAAHKEAALAAGVVFAECPEDKTWAGLDATITAALSAFERGVWGPRTVRHEIAGAVVKSPALVAMVLADPDALWALVAEERDVMSPWRRFAKRSERLGAVGEFPQFCEIRNIGKTWRVRHMPGAFAYPQGTVYFFVADTREEAEQWADARLREAGWILASVDLGVKDGR